MTTDTGYKQAAPAILRVRRDAHWAWFDAGWKDFKASWEAGLSLGALVWGSSATLAALMLYAGYGAWIPFACGLFILIAPLFATACYGVSARLHHHQQVHGPKALFSGFANIGPILSIGVVLCIIAALWAGLAKYLLDHFGADISGLRAFLAWALETKQGLAMSIFGTIVGGILAVSTFALAFIALPMVAHTGVSALVAMELSVEAVLRNPWVALGFAFVIAVSLAGAMFLAFLPLVVIFPWLGFATWHAYLGLTGQATSKA